MSISSDVSIATGVKISMVIQTALEAAKMYLFLKPHHSSLQILHKINTNVHTGCTCSSSLLLQGCGRHLCGFSTFSANQEARILFALALPDSFLPTMALAKVPAVSFKRHVTAMGN